MPLSLLADNDDLSQLFGQFDIEGTLLIESVDRRTVYLPDDFPGDQAYIPASTFKIPPTLVAKKQASIH
jgi:beta-lactamase class D